MGSPCRVDAGLPDLVSGYRQAMRRNLPVYSVAAATGREHKSIVTDKLLFQSHALQELGDVQAVGCEPVDN
jgi:hypothetical protein